jgi:acetylornithine deacetylase/succinyl-diaminopimelate desuccinylase-like protein
MFVSRLLLLIWLLSFTTNVSADQASDKINQWRQAHEQQIVDRFASLLSIPNVASDTANIRRNANHISRLLKDGGMSVELLELEGSNPVIFAERKSPGATRTVMIYIHYDGQPVNADNWASDPWIPVMRTDMVENGGRQVPMKTPFDPEWRIFGRSAGDDKAPIIALHSALLALKALDIEPTVNVKVFMEAEEEAGSPNLRRMIEAHKGKLDADLWLFCDGPVHQSRRWQLVYGVRGTYGFNITVYGPNRPLHSGHYGNWAPNPIMLLTELIGSMREGDGNILVEGYYQQVKPLSSAELTAIAASPQMDQMLTADLGIGRPETNDRLELAITRPAMNIRGIRAGDVGAKARNAIQVSASASIGLRLVPDQTPRFLREVIEKHITAQGYHIIREEPTADQRQKHQRLARINWSSSGGYPAYRADFDNALAVEISEILNKLSDGTLIQTPTMGGSLPLYIVEDVLKTPILILPVANHDNNQHGANENLRLQNLWDGIEIYAAVLTGL